MHDEDLSGRTRADDGFDDVVKAGSADDVLTRHAAKATTRLRIPATRITPGLALDLPVAPDSLAYDAVIAGIAVAGVIELPVAVVLIAGHTVVRHLASRRVREAVTEALESAGGS